MPGKYEWHAISILSKCHRTHAILSLFILCNCWVVTLFTPRWTVPWRGPLIAWFMGPTLGPSGADRTQWAPCWPHESCYLGLFTIGANAWTQSVFPANWQSKHTCSVIDISGRPYDLANNSNLPETARINTLVKTASIITAQENTKPPTWPMRFSPYVDIRENQSKYTRHIRISLHSWNMSHKFSMWLYGRLLSFWNFMLTINLTAEQILKSIGGQENARRYLHGKDALTQNTSWLWFVSTVDL